MEWRTNDPVCLVGYSATSKVRSGKASHNQDTYAEETFRKLGKKQPAPSSRIKRSEKGDWIPSGPGAGQPAERREVKPFRSIGEAAPGEGYARNPDGMYSESSRENLDPAEKLGPDPFEAEKASLRLEARLKREQAEEAERNEVERNREAERNREVGRLPENRPESLPPKPKFQERVISRNRNATIIESCDITEEPCSCPPGRGENPRKSAEPGEKRRKLDEVMDLELPDNYEEEFWS